VTKGEAAGAGEVGFSQAWLRCPMAGEGAPGHQRGTGAPSAIGTPSARLSLIGLRPRRARLRFTRRADANEQAEKEQEQRPGASQSGSPYEVYL
jgi:hypothetical protein